MLYDPTRHERLQGEPWDETRARGAIAAIVRDTEARYAPQRYWPLHPRDVEGDEDPSRPATPLYHGACGVVWALRHLQATGAATLSRSYLGELDALLHANRAWLVAAGIAERASFMMGDTPIELLAYTAQPDAERAERLAALIAGNIAHPARELLWGSPGTLLAALFLHERSGDTRWAELFRETAARLASELLWSDEHGCHYWTQDLYGRQSTYLDAVHGFVATASPLIRGRYLLDDADWAVWQARIAATIARTAIREGDQATWPAELLEDGRPSKWLMQFCHGAPGFVICLREFPGHELDELLLAAGRAVWAAGPLAKGSNLCHGTAGNGYAFLSLYQRTGDKAWLERARAYAMHGISQAEAAAAQHGQGRYSLWTGDLGLAIYLSSCIEGDARFPTLDVF